LAPPCNIPTGLSSTGVTTTDATLNWTAVSGAVGYNVNYRVVGAPSWTSTTATSNTKTLSSLIASTNYEWRVQTNCGSSNLSALSGLATFTTLTPPPVCSVISGIDVLSISTTTATLRWGAEANAAGYNIQYRIVGAPSWTTATSTSEIITISSLSPSTNYELKVQTDCGSSNVSAFSDEVIFTTSALNVPACDIPAGAHATNITVSSATIEWNSVSNAAAYNVQYRAVGDPTWILLNSSSKSISVNSLNPSTQYECQVQTDCGSSNTSAFSGLAKFTTSFVPVCNNIPTGLNTTEITHVSARLNWSVTGPAADAVMCEIQYRVVGAPSWISIPSPSQTNIISSLTPATNYEWQVRSNCSSSLFSAFSNPASFTTLDHAPANTSASNYPLSIPDPNNPSTWITVIASSGNAETDAQIVHDWLVAHGCIDN
ncbi:MAG: fibronectin type III domain-containing protein, partial [Bacteroidia bacterium]|nr:fibronectin type III domain-containing protein [Bacteroidia bacterium]